MMNPQWLRRVNHRFGLCRSRSSRGRMSCKAATAVLLFVTVILGSCLKYFEGPTAAETIKANRNLGSFERPSFFKNSNSVRKKGNYTIEKLTNSSYKQTPNVSRKISDESHKQFDGSSLEGNDNSILLDNNVPISSSAENARTEDEAAEYEHGIKEFDWDGWVKENDFVNIGSLWGYCDDEDPVMIGKFLLFDDSGHPSITVVFNTTFDTDITNGTAEGSLTYYNTKLKHKKYNLCELADKYEDEFFECPISAGEKYYIKEKPVSRFMPSGEYSVELSMTDQNGRVVICGAGKMKI